MSRAEIAAYIDALNHPQTLERHWDETDEAAAREGRAAIRIAARRPHTGRITSRKGVGNTFGGRGGRTSLTGQGGIPARAR